MILPDVNTLVYAFHSDTANHRSYADWLRSALAGSEPILLTDVVLTGFLRIATH